MHVHDVHCANFINMPWARYADNLMYLTSDVAEGVGPPNGSGDLPEHGVRAKGQSPNIPRSPTGEPSQVLGMKLTLSNGAVQLRPGTPSGPSWKRSSSMPTTPTPRRKGQRSSRLDRGDGRPASETADGQCSQQILESPPLAAFERSTPNIHENLGSPRLLVRLVLLALEVEICAVQLPGRETKLREAPITDLTELGAEACRSRVAVS